MSSTDFSLKSRQLRTAMAAAALLAAGGTAQAATVSKSAEYTCPFPLINEQPIVAEITTELPETVEVGETVGPFQVEATTLINEDSRTGLTLVGSTTLEGTAQAKQTIITPAGSEPLNVSLTIPETDIPQTTGSFEVPASGQAPEVSFDDADVGSNNTIELGNLTLDITARTADGSIAPDPIGEFVADCTLNADQDPLLHTFEVVPGGPTEDPADIAVTPEAVDFERTQNGLTAEQTVTVANEGDLSLGINNVTLSGPDADRFMQSSDCTSVAGGQSCTVTVTYFAEGDATHNATLTIDSTDADESSVEVPLSGESFTEKVPMISVDPTEVDFGTVTVGQTQQQDLTVENTGEAVLNVTSVSVDGDTSLSLVNNGCVNVNAGATCPVTVAYAPTTEGTNTADLTIESNADGNPVLTVPLTGEGGTGSTVDFLLDVEGQSMIEANGGTLPLNGTIDAVLNLSTRMYEADLTLEKTSGTFRIIRFFSHLKAQADVAFEQVGKTTGSLIDGTLTSKSKAYVEVPKVRVSLFGFGLPIGGGDECRTAEPVTINLESPEGETFKPLEGGNLTGTYELPPLENCGALTDIINQLMAGPGNTIDLSLTPQL
ncbi:choice-of-anchor D domain-containing protein [Tamilnaduibacter salinus]|uniref:choice-of-anchor D domain-containing protein n=1 Tax=Tamilnaduibacter salinus TaxID=1484056 RepID=UPI001D17C1FF|nr:choice-of-anchor D domain-containing protein [Tamilnaduibacter salinus]